MAFALQQYVLQIIFLSPTLPKKENLPKLLKYKEACLKAFEIVTSCHQKLARFFGNVIQAVSV